MIDCISGKAIRHHSEFSGENEIRFMPRSFLRVFDKHSPAEHLYMLGIIEITYSNVHNGHDLLETYQGVDICFAIDSTESMQSYFEKVKRTITCIIGKNQGMMKKLGKSISNFRFAIVDYRDHPPEGDYICHTYDFTTDTVAKAYITKLESGSGGDFPEAVLDGLDTAYILKWRDKADCLLFHILASPPHGSIYHTQKDDKWPDGCPCGKTAQDVFYSMKKKNIIYHVLRCSNHLNMMITEFKN